MALEASKQELDDGGALDLASITLWAGMSDVVQKSWSSLFGFPELLTGVKPRLVVGIPWNAYEEALALWRIEEAAATEFHKSMARSILAIALAAGRSKAPAVIPVVAA